MSYTVILSPRGRLRFHELPPDLVPGLEAALLRLAESPTTLSVKIASPPYPPRGQLYHFRLPGPPGSVWFFTVFFQFSQDETALWVLTLTWRLIDED